MASAYSDLLKVEQTYAAQTAIWAQYRQVDHFRSTSVHLRCLALREFDGFRQQSALLCADCSVSLPRGVAVPVTDSRTPSGPSLLFAGQVFCDLVFTGVEVPDQGAEAFADGFRFTPGGIANKAVAAARAGADTILLSAIGDDPLGSHIRTLLDGEPRLDTSLLDRVAGWQTPVTVSLTSPDDRSFITYQESRGPHALPARIGPVSATHIALDRDLPEWVGELRSAGTEVVGGVGWDHTGEWSERVLDRLSGVDVFVPNDAEAMRFTRTDSALEAAKALARRVPLAVVTCGGSGVVAVDSGSGQIVTAPSIPVRVRDTTGAGDVFVATFMASASRSWDLAARLRFASLCAGISVTSLGGAASAPRVGELLDYVRREGLAGDWSFLDGLRAA
jgi:sugar/nucleoside kinase (ribokinase family)